MIVRRKLKVEKQLAQFLQNQEKGSRDPIVSLSIPKKKMKWRAPKTRTVDSLHGLAPCVEEAGQLVEEAGARMAPLASDVATLARLSRPSQIATSFDVQLANKNIANLKNQVAEMSQTFRKDIDDLKRLVREVVHRGSYGGRSVASKPKSGEL